jgi:Immunity protein 49
MMITRHELKNPHMLVFKREDFYEGVEEGLPVLKRSPSELCSLSREILSCVGVNEVMSLGKEASLKDLHYSLAFGVAHYRLAANSTEQVKLDLEGKEMLVTGQIGAFLDFIYWLPVWRVANLLRENSALKSLVEATETLYGKEFSLLSDLDSKFTGLLHASLYREDINSALAQIERLLEVHSTDDSDYSKFLKLPELLVWKSVLSMDSVSFKANMVNGLEKHKDFWGTTENRTSAHGWISLPLLQVAAYAHDHGMDLDVESDYIPDWLVKRQW